MGAPTMHGIQPEKQGDILRRAAWLVDAGRVSVHVSRVFDLSDLPEAHKLQESGHATGKLAVRVK
jgi:NADPH:quinone reductase-like Zn-dependent oxidoreductase